jgi:hypothetical protein
MVWKICALHKSWDPAKYNFLPEPARLYERWLVGQAQSDRAAINESARCLFQSCGFRISSIEMLAEIEDQAIQ